MNIVSPYPLWYFFFCVVLGALLAFLLYRKDKKLVEFSKAIIGVLFSLRLLSITLLAALLLSPLIKYFNKTVEKPIIVIAQDNSSSMVMGKDSSFIKKELALRINSLTEELEKEYEVERFEFSDALKEVQGITKFDGKLTNFDFLFDDLSSRYANRNVGGLILISDGIYNEGNNPIYQSSNVNFPVFTVPVGDTTRYVDVKIQNLRSNKLAFLGNEFPVEFDIRLQEVKEKKLSLSISNGKETVFQKELVIDSKEGIVTVKALLKANRLGKQRYTVMISELPSERNTLNNVRDFYIEVLDGRQKIALLATAPHPDLGAIKKAISSNENYEVESGLLADFKLNTKVYDLIILHNNTGSNNVVVDPKLQSVLKAEVPLFLIGGGWGNMEKEPGLPINNARRVIKNEAQGIVNRQFNLFTLNDQLSAQIASFPPMNVYVGQENANTSKTLLYQKLGNVATKYPLLSFYNDGDRKVGRLYGEGIWKWRVTSYVQNKSHASFGQLIGKIIQFLAIKSDRSFFRINTKNEIFENESIQFNAQLFNPSYELVNEQEVKLKLEDQKGNEYDYVFSRRTKDYQLKINSLPPGTYTYTSEVDVEGKRNRVEGSFTIKELQLEQLNVEANYNTMYQMAAKSGGELLEVNELEGLKEKLKNRNDITAVSYINEEVEDIINLEWIFYLLIALLSIEWFIRKRAGAY